MCTSASSSTAANGCKQVHLAINCSLSVELMTRYNRLTIDTWNTAYIIDQAIIANADVSGRSSLWRIFSDDFWGTSLSHPGSHKSYRPLTILTFRLNYLLSGLYPFSYHFVNVICHAITSALFIALIDRLVQISQILKLFCGLLFAVHAVHAEAVASIVGRADVLSTMCVLGAFYIHLHNEAIFMPILISAVGLLCKETAVVSLPIIAFYCLIKKVVVWGERTNGCVCSRTALMMPTVIIVLLVAIRCTFIFGSPSALTSPQIFQPQHPSRIEKYRQ